MLVYLFLGLTINLVSAQNDVCEQGHGGVGIISFGGFCQAETPWTNTATTLRYCEPTNDEKSLCK